jgi:hypothetical protein
MPIYDRIPAARGDVIPGPIPFAPLLGGAPEEVAVMGNGPVDENVIHNSVDRPPLPVADVPLPTATPPPDAAMAEPMPVPPTSDPSLLAFSVPDSGPPPENDLEASLLDGMFNGPMGGRPNSRGPVR